MRVLLDECVPRRLKRDLPGHDTRTVPEMGWASKRNGDLLRVAEVLDLQDLDDLVRLIVAVASAR